MLECIAKDKLKGTSNVNRGRRTLGLQCRLPGAQREKVACPPRMIHSEKNIGGDAACMTGEVNQLFLIAQYILASRLDIPSGRLSFHVEFLKSLSVLLGEDPLVQGIALPGVQGCSKAYCWAVTLFFRIQR